MTLHDGRLRNQDRAMEVLDAIVRLNIETGRPVSSGLVERSLQRALSSATIRNVMKELEDAGFLEQPHTSAGRLPTDAGYRAFVDRLLAGWSLRRHSVPAGMSDLAREGLRRSAGSQDRIKLLAGLLGRLTDNISIIAGGSLARTRVARVECYPRSARRVLVVVVLENAVVRTALCELEQDTPAHVAAEAGRLFSSRLQGRALDEIRAEQPAGVDLVATPVTRCAAELSRGCSELFGVRDEGEIQLDGVTHVLAAPEFQDPEPLRDLIRFIESPRRIRESLAQLGGGRDGGFGVWIGAENPVGALRNFSILTGRVDLDGRPGILAVLGPRRMSYQRALHGIDVMRRLLAEPAGAGTV
jgi:heat-inducible transcriptional repressor